MPPGEIGADDLAGIRAGEEGREDEFAGRVVRGDCQHDGAAQPEDGNDAGSQSVATASPIQAFYVIPAGFRRVYGTWSRLTAFRLARSPRRS